MISEIIKDLVTWTPFLLGGFLMNILISVAAMMLFARRYRSHVPDELPGAALPA